MTHTSAIRDYFFFLFFAIIFLILKNKGGKEEGIRGGLVLSGTGSKELAWHPHQDYTSSSSHPFVSSAASSSPSLASSLFLPNSILRLPPLLLASQVRPWAGLACKGSWNSYSQLIFKTSLCQQIQSLQFFVYSSPQHPFILDGFVVWTCFWWKLQPYQLDDKGVWLIF